MARIVALLGLNRLDVPDYVLDPGIDGVERSGKKRTKDWPPNGHVLSSMRRRGRVAVRHETLHAIQGKGSSIPLRYSREVGRRPLERLRHRAMPFPVAAVTAGTVRSKERFALDGPAYPFGLQHDGSHPSADSDAEASDEHHSGHQRKAHLSFSSDFRRFPRTTAVMDHRFGDRPRFSATVDQEA
jgi:hypothetical protein